MEWNRTWSIGRESYVRLYPNPGMGLCAGKARIALSLRGGIEVFRMDAHGVWRRTYSKWSRTVRPGGR